jgi:hypothetical protein
MTHLLLPDLKDNMKYRKISVLVQTSITSINRKRYVAKIVEE